jgi:orotidine-5'-phosphate decarboxylase
LSVLDIPLPRRLILALDAPDLDGALDLVRRTRGVVGTYKIGLELFTAVGPSIFKALAKEDAEIFLDLKLHDIPNTVAGAVRAAARHEVSLLTVHASGGPAMLKAAQEALSTQTAIPNHHTTKLLAVTALTSMTGKELSAVGFSGGPDEVVSRLVKVAHAMGLYGCVCSPEEAALVRKNTGPDFAIVCPGIRSKDAGSASVSKDDQSRTASAFEAVRDGADYVVVGRPIRSAPDPAAAAVKLLEEIEAGLGARV